MTTAIQNLALQERLHPGPIRDASDTSFSARLAEVFLHWSERARQRRHLSQLTARELDDIGITFADAVVEASKPFWQA